MPTDGTAQANRPLVSVILAARNEHNYIGNTLESLLKQDADGFHFEILVIDGKSSDGTLEIARKLEETNPKIRVLINENQMTPSAFNLGLREARGDFVAILGAHAVYDRNYISACLAELRKTGAMACGGIVDTQPANSRLQAKLISWVLGNWFGSSSRSFRTRGEGLTDGVNFPVMVKQAALEVGGYDEQLHRNQDNDLNQRLRAHGHKLFVTAKTRCQYFSKPSIVSLLQYAFQNGMWNLISLRKNTKAMALRHFVPFCFVCSLWLSVVLWILTFFLSSTNHLLLAVPGLSILAAHLCCGIAASLQVSFRERSAAALLLSPLFLVFHLAYGMGTCWALLKRQGLPRTDCEGSAQASGANA
jgi:glycosyltransferase involved in cell wall biosynthesis